MKAYPVSVDLRKAIELLFEDPSVAYGVLAAEKDAPDDWYEDSLSTEMPVGQRSALLRAKIEGYLVQMAKEHDEMGSPEATDTLRMQAIGLLIALREVLRSFPELDNS